MRPGTGRGSVRWGCGRWSVPSSAVASTKVPLTRPRGSTTIPYMQVIAADAPRSRRDRLVILRSAATGVLLILAGVLIGWLCLGTPLASSFIPDGRPTTFRRRSASCSVGFAILVPAGFLVFGFTRMAHTIDAATSLRPTAVTPTLARAPRSRPPRRDRPPPAWRPPDPRARAGAVRDPRPGRCPARRGEPPRRQSLGDPRRPRPVGADRGTARSRVPRRRARPGLARDARPRLPRPGLRRRW